MWILCIILTDKIMIYSLMYILVYFNDTIFMTSNFDILMLNISIDIDKIK